MKTGFSQLAAIAVSKTKKITCLLLIQACYCLDYRRPRRLLFSVRGCGYSDSGFGFDSDSGFPALDYFREEVDCRPACRLVAYHFAAAFDPGSVAGHHDGLADDFRLLTRVAGLAFPVAG